MFLLKHIAKKPMMTKFMPLLARSMAEKTETGELCQCKCGPNCQCRGTESLSDFEPAGVKTVAPDFKAKAWQGGFKDISLSDYKGKYVVLFFYPMDFTFVCPTEIIEFSKKSPQFRESSKDLL